jgi:hypothetical protein
MLHLLADVEQIVLDVLKHAHFGYDQLPETIGLQDDLFPDQVLYLVHLHGNLSEYQVGYLL